MEDTLGALNTVMNQTTVRSLNPCFNGRYSRSNADIIETLLTNKVLILVLMEDTLGAIGLYS